MEPTLDQSNGNAENRLQKAVTLRRIFGAVGGNIMVLIVGTASAMVNVKVCLTFLGKSDYGIVVLVGTVAGWTALGDLGFGTAVRQRVTVLLAQGKTTEAARIVSSGVAFYSTMAVVLIAAVGAAYYLGGIGLLIKGAGADVAHDAQMVFLGVGLFVLTFPLNSFGGLMLARNDFLAHNLFAVSSSILRPVVAFTALSTRSDLVVFFLAMTGFRVLEIGARYAYVLLKVPELRVRLSLTSVSVVRQLAAPSLLFSVISIGYIVVYSTDNAVISSMIGLAAIPAYAAGFRLFSTSQKPLRHERRRPVPRGRHTRLDGPARQAAEVP